MLLEAYVDNDFYEKRYYVSCRIIDPNDLEEAVRAIMCKYISRHNIPIKALRWSCEPAVMDIGFSLIVQFTLTLDQIMNMEYS